MIEQDDLKPWRASGGPAFLSDAAQAHRAVGPSEDTLLAMLQGVQAGAELPTPHFDAAPSVPASSLLGPLASKLGALLVVAALGVGVWLHGQPSPAPRAQPSVAQPAPQPAALPAPLAPPVVEAVAKVPERPATLATRSPRRAKASTREPVRAVELAPEPAPASPLAELALLRRARRALAGDASLALQLTEQHRTSFPAGTFGEERELLAIEALVALSRRAEADARAAAFRTQHPASLHLRRLDVVLER